MMLYLVGKREGSNARFYVTGLPAENEIKFPHLGVGTKLPPRARTLATRSGG